MLLLGGFTFLLFMVPLSLPLPPSSLLPAFLLRLFSLSLSLSLFPLPPSLPPSFRIVYALTPFYPFLDVQFWRSRKTLEGLSVRSVFFNVFQSFVVLLYILDNETNTVVIISVFVGESASLEREGEKKGEGGREG